tara:strand:+ start:303 stop:668 length:366 start_codon:yes stop_codon:yes gene_type:complete
MFKKDRDNTDEKIIRLHLNKLYGKYDVLTEMKKGIEYIYKDLPIDEIDKSVRPQLTKKDVDLKEIYDLCYNSNNNTPFCTKLKEGFTSLDNITVDNKKTKYKKSNNSNDTRNFYGRYYNNM